MQSPSTPVRLIRRDELLRLIPFGKSTLFTKIQEGSFPAPVALGARAVAWREDEIAAWIEAQPRVIEPRRCPANARTAA